MGDFGTKARFALAGLCLIGLLVSGGWASTIEDTLAGVAGDGEGCYQNDGPLDDSQECDASDTCDGAYHYITTEVGEQTSGMLVAGDDEHDYFLADVSAFVGDRVRFDVAAFSFEVSTELYGADCGLLASPSTAAEEASAPAAADPAAIYSGDRPFRPITVGFVTIDAEDVTSVDMSLATGALDFNVANSPKSLTFDSVNSELAVDSVVRLCDYEGDVFVSIEDGEGVLKFDGVALSFEVAASVDGLSDCGEASAPDPDPVCGATYCEITVGEDTSTLVLATHFHGVTTPAEPIVVPASCHDACLGFMNSLPAPGGYDIGFTKRDA